MAMTPPARRGGQRDHLRGDDLIRSHTALPFHALGITDCFSPSGQSVKKTLMRTPVDGAAILRNGAHPILGYNQMHRGVDRGPPGTPIMAAGDGVIDKLNGAYGKYLRIRHSSTYKTAYAHLSRYRHGLKQGSRVRQGQTIGYVGSTGRSTGPHLHYEVLINGHNVTQWA